MKKRTIEVMAPAGSWQSLQAAKNGLNNIIKEISFYEEPLIGCAELEEEF